MAESIVIISSRTASSPASNWSEYLCLTRNSDRQFELSVRVYEVLGDVADYEQLDDAGNDVVPQLPVSIGGKRIVGVEDDFIIGGELVHRDEDFRDVAAFNSINDEVIGWLRSVEWFSPEIIHSIEVAID